MNKIYIPSKSQIIPILENYLTYSENSICYHYNNQQYKLLIPRKILQIYPLQIPNNSQFIIIIFTNGITLNRLQFQNNKLINSTLFSFSTIITSIDDISMKMIDGKISFAMIFNSLTILSFMIHPLDLFSFIPFAFTEFMITNNTINEEVKNQLSLKLIKLKQLENQSQFISIVNSRVLYIATDNEIYKVNENGELLSIVSNTQFNNEKIIKVCIGKDLLKKDNKEEMIVLTEKQCYCCIVSQKEFTIKYSYNYYDQLPDMKENKENIISISSLYQRSITLLALSTKSKTIVFQISGITTSSQEANELVIREYEGGKTQLFSMFHLLENMIYLIIQNATGNKRIEIEITIEKEKSKILPLLPLYDDEIKSQYSQLEEQIISKRIEIEQQQNEQMNQYVEHCEKLYGNALHTSMELSLSKSLQLDDYEEKIIDDSQLEIVSIDDEWLTQLEIYVKEFDEIYSAINEMDSLLQHITELKGKYEENMKEYDQSYSFLNDY